MFFYPAVISWFGWVGDTHKPSILSNRDAPISPMSMPMDQCFFFHDSLSMVTFCWIYHGNKTPSIFGYGWPTTNSHEVAKGNIIWHIHVQAASTGLFFPSSTLSAAQDKQILKEIIVVDDGSRPPLRKIMSEQLLSGGPGVPKMKIVRHEHTLGLISAKKSGDVFFCWWFGMLFVWVILFCDIMISILICIYIYST